jgi:hypothetical protein
MVHVGGWFDIFTQGTLDTFRTLQERGGDGARGRQHLVMGPWTHGTLFGRSAGQLTFPANATLPPGLPEEVTWLRYWLIGEPDAPSVA